MVSRLRAAALGAALTVCVAAGVAAANAAEPIEQVQVTATRLAEPIAAVPADVSVITGDELAARAAHSLAATLALTAGVEAPAGGDAGPSSAVPSFWGLHEFDAFLLVVDGVPWGGAFNPSIPDLDFNDLERVEVLKGSAPVMFGATSFVGVIQLLHKPAGEATNDASIAYGTRGSWQAAFATALPESGGIRQSLAADAEQLGFDDGRERVRDQHVLYRAAGGVAGGTLSFDADLALTQDIPPSPIVLDGTALTTVTPRNANYNPANAKIGENRYHATLRYDRKTGLGDWQTTLSFAHSDIRDVRGFVRPGLIDDGSSQNADSQDQHRRIDDAYADTHISRSLGGDVDVVLGADLLYGLGRQRSINGAYYVPLNGTGLAPATTALHVDEINTIRDQRLFAGQYLQADWKPLPWMDLNGGVRINETSEDKTSAHADGFDPAADLNARQKGTQTRVSGTIGASARVYADGPDQAVLYADYRDAFKPAAIDFGPDYTPDLLKPETAQSVEAGAKLALMGGRLYLNASAFLLDFTNLVVATTDALGNPILVNAGGERLQGAEVSLRYRLTDDLQAAGSLAYHDAHFTHYIFDDGSGPVNVQGKQLTLSPRFLGAAGLIYAPAQGLHGTLTANFIGKRYLNAQNTAPAGAYSTLAATLGYRFGRYDIAAEGENLTGVRTPVSASEFGQQSYYLLNGRRVFIRLNMAL